MASRPENAEEKWRTHLEDWEIFLAELVCGRETDLFAYPVVGEMPAKPGWDRSYAALEDEEINRYFLTWLKTRQGVQRYRTDPVEYEWGSVRERENEIDGE